MILLVHLVLLVLLFVLQILPVKFMCILEILICIVVFLLNMICNFIWVHGTMRIGQLLLGAVCKIIHCTCSNRCHGVYVLNNDGNPTKFVLTCLYRHKNNLFGRFSQSDISATSKCFSVLPQCLV